MAIGLPPTFIGDFTALVDQLQDAVDVRLNSKTLRGEAQAGMATALARGPDVIRDLEVVMAVAASDDPVLAATWRTARRIEGQRSSSRRERERVQVAAPVAVDVVGRVSSRMSI